MRRLHLVTTPILVATETGKIFFHKGMSVGFGSSPGFENRARDRVRGYFAP